MLEILVRREINGTGLKDLHDVYEKIEELNLTIRTLCGENMDKAAYDEFLLDKEAEEFYFDDYSVVLQQDEYCIAELMLALHKDLGVPLSEGVLQGKVVKFAKTLGNLSR